MTGLRERQKADRLARILRAAAHGFETRGYARTGIQEIAQGAGLAVGTVYNYFRSKPEIALALVQRDSAAVLAAGEALLEAPPRDPVAAVRALVDVALEPFVHRDRALWRALVAASMRDPGLLEGLVAEDLRLIALLAALLRKLQERGALRREVEPGRAALVLYGVFFSWFLAWISRDGLDPASLRREVHGGIELVMRGLCAPLPQRRRTR